MNDMFVGSYRLKIKGKEKFEINYPLNKMYLRNNYT